MNSVDRVGGVDQRTLAVERERLRNFRADFYRCLGPRADELFELTDALLCAEGPARSLVELCLAPEHRRGHGAREARHDASGLSRFRGVGLPDGPPCC